MRGSGLLGVPPKRARGGAVCPLLPAPHKQTLERAALHAAGLLLKRGSGAPSHTAPVLHPDLGAGPRPPFFSAPPPRKPSVLMGGRCEGGLRTPSLRKGNRKTQFPSTSSGPNSTPSAPAGTVEVFPRSPVKRPGLGREPKWAGRKVWFP